MNCFSEFTKNMTSNYLKKRDGINSLSGYGSLMCLISSFLMSYLHRFLFCSCLTRVAKLPWMQSWDKSCSEWQPPCCFSWEWLLWWLNINHPLVDTALTYWWLGQEEVCLDILVVCLSCLKSFKNCYFSFEEEWAE